MKAIVVTKTVDNKKNAIIVCDSAIIRAKDPFFLPNDLCWKALCLQGVRINRLGKSINASFAERYYDECLSAVHPYCANHDETYLQQWGFDGALVVSEPAPVETLSSEFQKKVDRIISEVSGYATLKTGDLILLEAETDSSPAVLTKGDFTFSSDVGTPSLKLKVR